MRNKRRGMEAPVKRLLIASLLLFFAAEILGGGVHVWLLLREYDAGKKVYAGLEEYVSTLESTPVPVAAESAEPQDSGIAWPQVDFEALRAINSDIVGWIRIEGTDIDYPIVQAGDNDYYLRHLFSGEVNRAGCIFLDCGNSGDFSDPNSVIYGHHLKNGTMFTELLKYKKQDFYDAHPTALLLTPGQNYEVQFFSGYVSAVDGFAWDLDFLDGDAFLDWQGKTKRKSLFSSDFFPTAGDRVITLSTCSYEFNNARFVLIGVLHPA